MNTPQAFDTTPIDQALGELHHAAAGWAAVSLPERIALLERMMPRVTRRAKDMVAAAAVAKGYEPTSRGPQEGPDHLSGYYVYPREIEEVLYEHPAVAEAAVVGVAHPEPGEEVAAVVVQRGGARTSDEGLRQFVRERVAPYEYPREV
jgi:acyl-CoA reductase-like NAD-dependent aldehyde dehydrogenase